MTAGPPFIPTLVQCLEEPPAFYESALHNSSAKESSAQPSSIENIPLGKQKHSPGFGYIYSRQMKCIN